MTHFKVALNATPVRGGGRELVICHDENNHPLDNLITLHAIFRLLSKLIHMLRIKEESSSAKKQ
jgi:hypothetical protein